MSFYITAKKDTQEILESGFRKPDLVGDYLVKYKEAIAQNYSDSVSNIEIFVLDDSHEDAIRVSKRDQFDIVWSKGSIASLNFSIEDDKKWLRITTNNSVVKANGKSSVIVSIETLNSNKSEIDSTINGGVKIPIVLPSGQSMNSEFRFYNGKASKKFTSLDIGVLQINSKSVIDGYRIEKDVSVEFEI